MRVRRLLGWQATEYDGRIRYGTVPLTNLQHGKIMLFTSYTLVGLTLLTSSFFLMLLENYGLQLHHLMPHSLTLVAIFVHLCEMYVVMRPFVRLFQLFFAL
jgi:branched-subunit amino acid ABC-type transport system permease component